MIIQTKYLGEMEIEESNAIKFPSGLPGFIDETDFVLLGLPGNPIFKVLQSTRTPNLAFIAANPYHFYEDYVIDLDDSIIENLQIRNDKEVVVLTIVTLKDPFENSTMNLKAPIIINSQKQRGKQYILNVDHYSSQAAIAPTKSSLEKGE
ncbi:flagellar assembly protein FliW [Virgibacillus doumboii]|uniref:flagellar assembly protein FliW n=1 Tax=Virgibacillus doumboii TaxID=2697503 RepID=UPI0013DE8A6B|nr:flagellar assembly protein FliW [Virgibacillus doumboii]